MTTIIGMNVPGFIYSSSQYERTKYNMKFRSGKFFPEIGDKMIFDEFTVDFDVKAK